MSLFGFFTFSDLMASQLPQMNPWPGSASVLLMDNCAIHKSQILQDAVAEKGECAIFHD